MTGLPMKRARLPLGWLLLVSSSLILLLVLPTLVVIAGALAPARALALLTPAALAALRLSLVTTGATLGLTVLFGTPLAYLLARYDFPAKHLVETLVELPIVLPPTVAGLSLLLTFGRRGLLGQHLELLGINIAFSSVAVVLAQLFVASPLYVRALRSGFARSETTLEAAALTLGAGRWRSFWQVSLPLAKPQLAEGVTLTWARALGEFGATLVFAGSLPGRTQTMPLAIYAALETDLDAAFILSAILSLVAFALLGLFRRAVSYDQRS